MGRRRSRSSSRTRQDDNDDNDNVVEKPQSTTQKQPQAPAASEDSDAAPAPAASSDDTEEPPKPVSSDDESLADKDSAAVVSSKAAIAYSNMNEPPSSRLFSPYRSLGQVSSGRPFFLLPHQNSASSMLAVPVDNHFQLVATDKLQPVLVSQGLPGQTVLQTVSDATLSVTVVASSSSKKQRSVRLTLFHRTAPLQAISPVSKDYKMVDLLHLGRISVDGKGEKEGQTENAAIVAVVFAKNYDKEQDEDDDDVDMVGDDDESDSEDEEEQNDDDKDGDDCMGQVVLMVATRTSLHIQKRIRFTGSLSKFVPVTALHPSTYLNKIVVAGGSAGEATMVLLNVRSGKVVHNFQCLPAAAINASASEMVTTLEQSPAVDTIAVGTDNGNVHLVNLRHDKKLFSLRHKSLQGKSVTIQSISFRTDGSAMHYGIAPMAVGRSDGTITIWDLTPPETSAGREILCEMDRVHPGGIAKLQYLPQEPLLVSTGTESNSILMHIFDNPDHSARVLRQRKGHTAPPSRIRYLHPGAGAGGGVMANASDGTDASACQILSSGGFDRTLRIFSTARSVLDKEYSQGQGLEKRAKKLGMESTAELLLPPLTAMATSESRSRDWGDLITIHQDHAFAYIWSTRRGAQSGPLLRQPGWNISAMKVPPPTRTHATSVAMSACGNFALVGTRGGIIYKYNVQSGNPRGSYPRDATDEKGQRQTKAKEAGDVNRTMKALEKKLKVNYRASNLDKKEADALLVANLEEQRRAKLLLASHTGAAVTGLAVDSVNKTLISVGSDSKLVLWNFGTHAPHKKSPYTLPSPATKMCHVRDSDLAAIALHDFTVVLFDCAALSIVRRFGSSGVNVRHKGPISDLAFSPDGRNLFTSSLDGTVRVWDVPTNSCVDWLSFSAPPTSLTISATGEFMATTHAGKLGISVWSDRSFYQTVHVDGSPLLEPAPMDDPAAISESLDPSQIKRSKAAARGQARRKDETKEEDHEDDSKVPAVPKESGLITLSGLPPSHWKNLFHLELVKERNKPKEPPKKPPSAPFFLQWRSGEALSDTAGAKPGETGKLDDEEWAAAWSDDDEEGKSELLRDSTALDAEPKRDLAASLNAPVAEAKRRKITHYRSHFASLLEQCAQKPASASELRFQAVTDHIATLGPSAIDVALSSLCNGMHDLEEGLPMLQITCRWLLEACESRERYEAVNAYLHRFLYLHASVITGVDESFKLDEGKELSEEEKQEKQRQSKQRTELLGLISQLRQAQAAASEVLRGQMQHTLCLLRHFSRMV
jgi:U3 small nucleolar RNA-associated protein 21